MHPFVVKNSKFQFQSFHLFEETSIIISRNDFVYLVAIITDSKLFVRLYMFDGGKFDNLKNVKKQEYHVSRFVYFVSL